jgi:hypothetical protein
MILYSSSKVTRPTKLKVLGKCGITHMYINEVGNPERKRSLE